MDELQQTLNQIIEILAKLTAEVEKYEEDLEQSNAELQQACKEFETIWHDMEE